MLGARLAAQELDTEIRADLDGLRSRLDGVLATKPLPIVRAKALAAAYQSYVESVTVTRPASRSGRAQS